MYHCHIRFYLIGRQQELWEQIRAVPPFENFTHTFTESSRPEAGLLAQADVIFVDLLDMDVEQTLPMLTGGKRPGAELILLAARSQAEELAETGMEITDLWSMPMSRAEIRFRFARWMQTYKLEKDYWQAYRDEIEESGRMLGMLFSTMDCGMMYHSVDGQRVISINKAALRLLDYESQDELQRDGFNAVAQSVLDEDKPKLRECINSLKKVGASANVEYRVRHKDGKLLYILGNVKLVEEHGELFYQRFLVDVTDAKLREKQKWKEKNREIRYQERLFEIFSTFLADNVDDVYIMLNESGTAVEFVTPNIERVLGLSVETVLKNAKELGRFEYITGGGVDHAGLAALKPGMALEPNETKRIHQKTGEEKWFRESLYCVSVQGIKRIVLYISDRTKERQNRDVLSQALEIAQVANRAKSAFLRNVSHDIRTPMNAIMGFTALLREEADSPEHVLEYTQKISDASQYLLGLINNVLDMNKIESGSAVLDVAELNLAELVDEVDAIIRLQAEEKEQSFEIAAVSLTNKHLLGDKLRIKQILTNILSNAVEYTQNGGEIKMWIDELPQIDESYSRICFTISDNGQGMSEEYQKVIFDPFTREQSTAWNQMHGTGLGMAVTKSLVELMNGSIMVTSKLGEGSTFVVELELRIQDKEDVRRMPDPVQKEAADSEMESVVKGRRVLVVDDIDVNRMVLVKILKTLGAECDTANNGQEAVEKFAASQPGRYDLILMDVQMPCMDGHEATRMIRAGEHPEAKTIPIIAMSANAFVDDVRGALGAGMDAHVAKPIVLTQLESTIQEVLERKRAAGD